MSPVVTFVRRTVVSLLTVALLYIVPTLANPSHYPQFAQHQVDPAIPIFFIGVKRVKAQLDAGQPPVLVDVRSLGEYNAGHLPKARSIPLEELPRRLAEIPRDIPVVLYWSCPHHLASLAYQELYRAGYRNMQVLDEGLPGWTQQQYPLEGPERRSQLTQ